VHEIVSGLFETNPGKFRNAQIIREEANAYQGKRDTDANPDAATRWIPTSAILDPPRDCSRRSTHAVQSPLTGLQMLK
jgi:hypothetical protein